MTITPEKQRRLTLIQTTGAEARRLIDAARHDSLKAMAELAVRDLNEATEYLLHHTKVEHEPWILGVVDAGITLATARLTTVAELLRTHGPDAMGGS
jgi:hypothetical protein